MEMIKKAYKALDDQKARDIKLIDVKNVSPITDYMILATAETERHAKKIEENVKKELKKEDLMYSHMDGYDTGKWIIMDYFDFLVHIFIQQKREYYDIDNLFRDTEVIKIND